MPYCAVSAQACIATVQRCCSSGDEWLIANGTVPPVPSYVSSLPVWCCDAASTCGLNPALGPSSGACVTPTDPSTPAPTDSGGGISDTTRTVVIAAVSIAAAVLLLAVFCFVFVRVRAYRRKQKMTALGGIEGEEEMEEPQGPGGERRVPGSGPSSLAAGNRPGTEPKLKYAVAADGTLRLTRELTAAERVQHEVANRDPNGAPAAPQGHGQQPQQGKPQVRPHPMDNLTAEQVKALNPQQRRQYAVRQQALQKAMLEHYRRQQGQQGSGSNGNGNGNGNGRPPAKGAGEKPPPAVAASSSPTLRNGRGRHSSAGFGESGFLSGEASMNQSSRYDAASRALAADAGGESHGHQIGHGGEEHADTNASESRGHHAGDGHDDYEPNEGGSFGIGHPIAHGAADHHDASSAAAVIRAAEAAVSKVDASPDQRTAPSPSRPVEASPENGAAGEGVDLSPHRSLADLRTASRSQLESYRAFADHDDGGGGGGSMGSSGKLDDFKDGDDAGVLSGHMSGHIQDHDGADGGHGRWTPPGDEENIVRIAQQSGSPEFEY